MKVFISWSGELSQSVALILRSWLKSVIQIVEPYVSSEDLEKGTRWFTEIDGKLGETKFGIVCLTRDNMEKPWILFEAGAISRSIDRSRVTPLLIDLSPADLSGPLAQFQATTISDADMLKLVMSIGTQLDDLRVNTSVIEQAFRKWWPDFQRDVTKAIRSSGAKEEEATKRPDREILEELLEAIRAMSQRISSWPTEEHVSARSSDLDLVLSVLENRRKMFLITVLQGARNAYFEGDDLCVVFRPEAKHLRDTLAKAENIKVLRDAVFEALGREVGIRISTRN